MSRPLLSVLIPAYNQPQGVERILARLAGLGAAGEVEVRVGDDSSDDAAAARIARAVQALAAQHSMASHYQRNQPPLGAVRNWNALQAQARGRYVWLLHHDEEPDEAPRFAALLDELRRDTADVWLLRCRVQHRPGATPRSHFPPRLAAALLRRWPGYLLRRNLIGPPSALIVRDQALVPYDERLVWLVDVEAYARLFGGAPRIAAWPQAGVLSRVDTVHSITAKLRPELKATRRREQQLLAAEARPGAVGPWLASTPLARLLQWAETLLWACLRLGQRLAKLGGRRP